jgi:hypothetical protein
MTAHNPMVCAIRGCALSSTWWPVNLDGPHNGVRMPAILGFLPMWHGPDFGEN